MKLPKKLSTQASLLIVLIGGLVVTSLVLYFNAHRNIATKTNLPLAESAVQMESNIPGLPVRLKIPSMEIDVPLEYVGVAASGAMDIPKSTDKVGWFELGTRPGEIGTAVMAGHYGLYGGKPSVFDNLHDLTKGDRITVEDENGTIMNFVVREIRSFDPQADATVVFSSDDEKSHLNLITCEGTWNKDAKSYSKRLVVFTDKE